MRNLTLVFITLLLCASSYVCAADWPQFRGPNADGIAPEKGINKDWSQKPPALLWKCELTNVGYAAPSVADGKVFILDHQGSQDIVKALDINTGHEVWRFAYDDTDRDNFGFARSMPVINDGKVYTLSKTGRVNCLNEKDGAKIWARNIIADFKGKLPGWELSMSPLVDGDKVILCPGGKTSVVALNKNTGETVWQGGNSDDPGYATPVAATIENVKQYVVFTASNLIGVEQETGKLLWSFPWPTGSNVNAATPIVIDNTIFITSSYGHGCALLEIAGGKPSIRWQNKEMQSHFSSPIYYKGYFYGTSDAPWGNLVCLDAKTGAATWKWGGFEKGGEVGVDGLLIVAIGDKGGLVMVNMTPVGYMELGRIKPLDGQCWTAPIVADGKLLVRNKNTMACLNLR